MTAIATNKNRRKIIGIATIVVSAALAYFVFSFQKLELTVFNTTRYDLDSLKIGNRFFSIKKGASVRITNCANIAMQAGLPFQLPEARVNRSNNADIHWDICGTGIKEVSTGQYKFDIAMLEDSSSYLLIWKEHK